MLILQKPEGYCFEKNIPDIILQKENAETVVYVSIKHGSITVLEENYKFDSDGYVNIKRIGDIVSAYLVPQKSVISGNVITLGLVNEFEIELNYGATQDVTIPISSSITTKIFYVNYNGTLTDILSVGDKVKSVGANTYDDVYILSIDSVAKIITLTNSVVHTNGDSFVFQHVVSDTFSFSALRCEADMPENVNAGIFASQNFLTRLPREKRTAINRNEYLSYIHFSTMADVVVNYKVIYLSNSVITEKTGELTTINPGTGNRHITFNASPAVIIEAAALSTETILQYDIWFSFIDETIQEIESNVFTFLMDYNNYRNKQSFVFENSFGVLETFTRTGLSENKKLNEYNLANIQNRYRKTFQDFISEKTVYSGFLSENEMEWIDDLLLSYNVAVYTPGVSGATEEITITGHEKTDTEENMLQAFQFMYRKSKNNHLQFVAAAQGIFDETYNNTFN